MESENGGCKRLIRGVRLSGKRCQWLAGGWGTNIVIDDKPMRDTLRATGLKTKREAVDEALRTCSV